MTAPALLVHGPPERSSTPESSRLPSARPRRDNRLDIRADPPEDMAAAERRAPPMKADPLDPGKLLEGTTPGPWKVEPGARFSSGPERQSNCHDGIRPLRYLLQFGEAEANARLIASAPDLARRLGDFEKVLASFAYRGGPGPKMTSNGFLLEFRRRLREARAGGG